MRIKNNVLVSVTNDDLVDGQFTIPQGVTSIGKFAFKDCKSLTTIEIPVGVTSIGDSAFNGCESLTTIEIPAGVTSIGGSAFNGCESLTTIEIPAGVTSIGGAAFNDCKSLTIIEIPAGVTLIRLMAFGGCESLTTIKIPAGVTSIERYAFGDCNSLTTVEIPAGVTAIGTYAFGGCKSLTTIEIPAGVTSIAEDAFEGCEALSFIFIDADNEEYQRILQLLPENLQEKAIQGKAIPQSFIKKALTILSSYEFSEASFSEFPLEITTRLIADLGAVYGLSSPMVNSIASKLLFKLAKKYSIRANDLMESQSVVSPESVEVNSQKADGSRQSSLRSDSDYDRTFFHPPRIKSDKTDNQRKRADTGVERPSKKQTEEKTEAINREELESMEEEKEEKKVNEKISGFK